MKRQLLYNRNPIYPFRLYEKPVRYNICIFCILIFKEAYPVKLKEVHVINTSAIVERFLSLVKPFLKEKIRKRVRITFILLHFLFHTIRDKYPPCVQEPLLTVK